MSDVCDRWHTVSIYRSQFFFSSSKVDLAFAKCFMHDQPWWLVILFFYTVYTIYTIYIITYTINIQTPYSLDSANSMHDNIVVCKKNKDYYMQTQYNNVYMAYKFQLF